MVMVLMTMHATKLDVTIMSATMLIVQTHYTWCNFDAISHHNVANDNAWCHDNGSDYSARCYDNGSEAQPWVKFW